MNADAHARLTELFGQAIDATASERARLIEQVRRDDPELAAELSALLAADAAPIMHTGAFEPTHDDRPPAQRAGFAVDGYRVIGVLGEGGMGTVYAAEQRAPRRPVAIKVLRSGSLARFATEAEVMARLDHPGIAKILEAGEADGHPYLVMERIEGKTLDVWTNGLALASRLPLLAQACEAVHHAHLNGVIHRDLKPSNLMVRPDERVVILDFGVARITGGDSGATRAGEALGTPHYMSPEQARLRPDEVDARSDVYALGVILYELIADALPYDLHGKSFPEIALAIGSAPPRPLRAHRDLIAITRKALAKEPADRYQSASALADDVRRHLAGDPIAARTPGALESLGRAARRRPGVAAAIAAALIATAGFAIGVTSLWLSARAARRTSEHASAVAELAREQLETRGNQLLLDRARGALERDPTESLRWLAAITPRGVDPAAAWAIADEALGRGVAVEEHAAHTDQVRAVEPIDGGLISAGYDGRALLFTRGVAEPRVLWRDAGRIHVAAVSPDGAAIALAGETGLIRVVDRDGAVLAEPRGLTAEVDRAVWSRDGRWLAAADDAGGVWLWPRGGGAGHQLPGPQASIEALAFARDGGALVAGDGGGTVWRWSLDGAPAQARRIDGSPATVWADGDEVAAVDRGGHVVHLRAGDGGLAVVSSVATGLVCHDAAFAPDGSYAIVAGDDGTLVRVAGAAVDLVAADRVRVRAIRISDDGRRFATGGEDGIAQVWDDVSGNYRSLRGHHGWVRAVAFTPDGGELLTGDLRGVVRRWPLDATPSLVLHRHRAPIALLAASPDGERLASADADGALRVWDLRTGGSVRLVDIAGRITGLALAGERVIAGTDLGAIAWWPLDGSAPRAARAPGAITAIATSRDGAVAAAGTREGPIGLYRDGVAVAVLAGHPGGTEAVAISPDGALLASGGQDRVVRLWSTSDPTRPPVELGPLADDTRIVRFSDDGAHLVAGGDDHLVHLWDVAGGTIAPGPGRVLASHALRVAAIAFTDGAVISIGGAGDVVRARVPGLSGNRTADAAAAEARFARDRLDPLRITATAGLAGDRIAVGLDDGAIAIRSPPRSLADLAATLAQLR